MKQGLVIDINKKNQNMIAVKEDNGPLLMVTVDDTLGHDLNKLIGKKIKYSRYRDPSGNLRITFL
ncbi:hypothetical protein [Vagococcus fluvialis]|uniref:Uncharacterized protein n=1 Tax=Vagococcus fluvialis TaxID=2738 RepID=A0A7X6D6L9_9ENTE|nr:hypothetical protein [Vagococcus fluvialis]NKC66772.1 hypothetical protein [Vagococcus fluvialis]